MLRATLLDDFGLKPLGAAEKHDLLEVIEDRHGIRSTLITSQLPVARWHEYLAETTLADALLDRLLHQSYKIELSRAARESHCSSSSETSAQLQPVTGAHLAPK